MHCVTEAQLNDYRMILSTVINNLPREFHPQITGLIG
jgi:hypothetical protein